ncbi:hypothetical protein [Shimazuella alba]|uniref:Uncharacterized protein n=1 Tax=Shimazuella alba TaxID=2690964 RepID=A0A6I4VM20_9BACL|nr:hypothetical protein [Shimazuella alba]MXQ52467.1 hypothetical protein [Shimazuella alba]
MILSITGYPRLADRKLLRHSEASLDELYASIDELLFHSESTQELIWIKGICNEMTEPRP